ncbi:hypothetical protein [Photobacterium sp. 1_MG-2023]|uniref:hypothetical protein n=1 Tax=Photobacterium sp. 1_MG-2023 TaxID=3062646 RepID=UPI0026E227BE|nr:hypothetical protein [Photobacterium sp. 1_MG-2023]MDO6706084.1 hypothetical protein [Photobacterium sp. 1_MG-2023]
MWKVLGLCFGSVILAGCSGMDSAYGVGEYTLFPKAYVNDEPYDSIYHYGYNQGCESSLSLKGVIDTAYMKDIALKDSDTRYNEGWEDGKNACEDGLRRIMVTSRLEVSDQPLRQPYNQQPESESSQPPAQSIY